MHKDGMEPGFPFDTHRPWGDFRQFTKNRPCTVKIITIKANESLSLQSHTHRSEFEHILSGSGSLEIGEEKFEVGIGDEHEVEKGKKHRFTAGPSGLQFLEISFGEFNEEDITRYEDKYGRV